MYAIYVSLPLAKLLYTKKNKNKEKHLFDYAQQVAELHDIPVNSLQPKRHTRLPSRFDDSVVLESTGSRVCISTNDEYKVDVYLPILDSFLGELKERFSTSNVKIMKAIQACSPQSKDFLDPDSLHSLRIIVWITHH